jgi:hypothetical protein
LRLAAVGLVGLVAVCAGAVALPGAATPAAAPAVQLARFGGGFHLGGRGLAARPRTTLFGRRTTSTRSRGILRRIGRALAFAAILHFLFAGSGGLGFLFLLVLIVGLVVLVSRGRRRRRAYYSPPPRW